MRAMDRKDSGRLGIVAGPDDSVVQEQYKDVVQFMLRCD